VDGEEKAGPVAEAEADTEEEEPDSVMLESRSSGLSRIWTRGEGGMVMMMMMMVVVVMVMIMMMMVMSRTRSCSSLDRRGSPRSLLESS
jgi:hypothetical protein